MKPGTLAKFEGSKKLTNLSQSGGFILQRDSSSYSNFVFLRRLREGVYLITDTVLHLGKQFWISRIGSNPNVHVANRTVIYNVKVIS